MRFGLADLVLVLLTLALAAGTRVVYLIHYADNAATSGPIQVQDVAPDPLAAGSGRPASPLEELVENMKAYRWFGCTAPLAGSEERTAYLAPGYPWLLGEGARLVPDATQLGPLVRWIQCGLGALTAVLYFLFARQAFGSRVVAGLTGVLCALHPFWVVDTAALSDGVLATFLLAAAIYFGARGSVGGGALSSLLFGLGLAGLALVRAALLPFAVVAELWFLMRCRQLTHGWLASVLSFLGLITGLAPWTIRNFEAFHDVYPIVDSTYLHIWTGNNPRATGGGQDAATLAAALAEARGTSPADTADWLASMSEPERYRALAGLAFNDMGNDPQAACQRRLWAGVCFFFGEDWLTRRQLWRDVSYPEGSDVAVPSSGPWPLLLTASLLGMLILGALGWRLTFGWRQESMLAALALVLVPLPYILSHAEALSGPRLPLDGVLLCFAAFTIGCLLPRVSNHLLSGSPDSEPAAGE